MNDMVAQRNVRNRTQRRVSQTRNRLLKGVLSVFAEAGTEAATIEMKLDHGPAPKIERFCRDYLCRIEELPRPFLPERVDDVKTGCLACAIVGFVSEFFPLG
jgi:hypothetical protein